jgi:hypothetical protein
LELANSTAEVVADANESAAAGDEIQAILISQPGTSLEIPSALRLPDVEYLDLLSSVNVIANKRFASSKSKGILDTFRGDGRDELTLF